jgi:DNA mismatch repair protein MutL
MSRYVLAFPEISFHYTSQGKNIYHSPGNGSLKDAIYCVYGGDLLDNIVHVSHEVGDVRVDGFVSRPGLTMKNRQKGSVFVNRRFVRNTALHDMVKSAYGPMLVKGESPFFALNIFLPASAVDVNVHPNKLQVRFRDASSVEYAIKEAVSQAGRQIHGEVKLNTPIDTAPAVPKAVVEMQAHPEVMQTSLFSGFARTVMKETLLAESEETDPDSEDFTVAVSLSGEEGENAKTGLESVDSQMEEPLVVPYGDRVIGSFADTYILVEQGDNLLIIDQHAAHERLLYDRFVSGHFSASQPLLVPQVVKVSHMEKNLIDDNISVFQALGFDIEPFGALEYKIAAVPMLFYSAGLYEMIAAALEEISQGADDVVIKRERIIRAACRSAVKAGDKLTEEELKSLTDSFLRTNVIPTCPHGRPVISVLTQKQIEKSFKRVL